MLTALLTTLLAVSPAPAQDDVPSKEQVAETVALLEKAYDKGDSAERIAALQRAAEVLDAEVIELVGKGMRDKDPEVQKAAIESLRFMRHPEALKELHACYKRDKKLVKDEELGGALLKAIGQHGSESSIPILTDSPFGTPNHAAIQARILGLGNIRSNESVEELMAMMGKVGRRNVYSYMDDFRLALMRLTGEDHGKSSELWVRWWNGAKKTLEVTPEAPRMREPDQKRWDYFWGNETRRERKQRRNDRGGDGGE
jgi:hypothetical protein